jgi:hypothetical protein
MPHNHNMWAVIGIYSGREDNIFWRRLPGEACHRIETAAAKGLSNRDVCLHVYGGDFFGAPRSEWDPERLPFIHGFGAGNPFLGRNAGNSSLSGAANDGSRRDCARRADDRTTQYGHRLLRADR